MEPLSPGTGTRVGKWKMTEMVYDRMMIMLIGMGMEVYPIK